MIGFGKCELHIFSYEVGILDLYQSMQFLPKYDSMGHKVQYHVIQDLGKLLIAGIYDWQYVRNAGKSKESMKSCFLDWLN